MSSLKKVFIDGSAGTTGLRIRERLARRPDLEVVVLPDELRKDTEARRQALNGADVAFLCLPDAAAVEAVSLVENPNTVVIDTSTAHRTAEGWEYGFPELEGRRARLRTAKRIANPGCHASGFVALVEPLVRKGVLRADAELCATSLTGYSGGGKKMIAEYEEKLKSSGVEKLKSSEEVVSPSHSSTLRLFNSSSLYFGGRQYALGQAHKHLPEMAKVCALAKAPAFLPIVVPHLSGMEVTVPVFRSQLVDPKTTVADLKGLYAAYYGPGRDAPVTAGAGRDAPATVSAVSQGLVRFVDDPAAAEGGFLSSAALSGKDALEVSVYGNDERMLLVSRFDNLGKGASGAAIQNMNVVLGVDETTGLVL